MERPPVMRQPSAQVLRDYRRRLRRRSRQTIQWRSGDSAARCRRAATARSRCPTVWRGKGVAPAVSGHPESIELPAVRRRRRCFRLRARNVRGATKQPATHFIAAAASTYRRVSHCRWGFPRRARRRVAAAAPHARLLRHHCDDVAGAPRWPARAHSLPWRAARRRSWTFPRWPLMRRRSMQHRLP